MAPAAACSFRLRSIPTWTFRLRARTCSATSRALLMRSRHMFGAPGFSAMAGRQVPLRSLSGWIKPLEPPPITAAAPTPVAPTECPEGQILVDGVCQPEPSATQVTTPPEPTPVSTPVQQTSPEPSPQPQPISTAPQPQSIPISTMPQPQPISTAPQSQSVPISTIPQSQPIQTAPPMGPEGVLVQMPPSASVPSPCDAGAWLRSRPSLGQVRLRRGLF